MFEYISPDYSRVDGKLRIKLLKIFYLYEIIGSPDLGIGECAAKFFRKCSELCLAHQQISW